MSCLAANEAATRTCNDVMTAQPDNHHSEGDADRTSNALVEDSRARPPGATTEPAEGSLRSTVEVKDKPQESLEEQHPSSRQATSKPAGLVETCATTTGPPVEEGAFFCVPTCISANCMAQ